MAVVAPMPRARHNTATAVKPLFFTSTRKPKRKFCRIVPMWGVRRLAGGTVRVRLGPPQDRGGNRTPGRALPRRREPRCDGRVAQGFDGPGQSDGGEGRAAGGGD